MSRLATILARGAMMQIMEMMMTIPQRHEPRTVS